jgi:hypothetical protein
LVVYFCPCCLRNRKEELRVLLPAGVPMSVAHTVFAQTATYKFFVELEKLASDVRKQDNFCDTYTSFKITITEWLQPLICSVLGFIWTEKSFWFEKIRLRPVVRISVKRIEVALHLSALWDGIAVYLQVEKETLSKSGTRFSCFFVKNVYYE